MSRKPALEIPPIAPVLSVPVPIIYESDPPVSWEYLQVEEGHILDETELNALGNDGWELVDILDREPRAIFFFKRRSH